MYLTRLCLWQQEAFYSSLKQTIQRYRKRGVAKTQSIVRNDEFARRHQSFMWWNLTRLILKRSMYAFFNLSLRLKTQMFAWINSTSPAHTFRAPWIGLSMCSPSKVNTIFDRFGVKHAILKFLEQCPALEADNLVLMLFANSSPLQLSGVHRRYSWLLRDSYEMFRHRGILSWEHRVL